MFARDFVDDMVWFFFHGFIQHVCHDVIHLKAECVAPRPCLLRQSVSVVVPTSSVFKNGSYSLFELVSATLVVLSYVGIYMDAYSVAKEMCVPTAVVVLYHFCLKDKFFRLGIVPNDKF